MEGISQSVYSGPARAPHRSLLRALGIGRGDGDRPLIGIANSYNEWIPGHMHLNTIAQQVKYGVYQAGGIPLEFDVIGVCDGLAMNHEGMNYSLVSREVIADSVEIMAKAHGCDGLVLIPNCDKIVPGMVMAAARVDIPVVLVSGGPMLAGDYQGKKVSLSQIFEGLGKYFNGEITNDQLCELEDAVCPTCGSCAGLFTANSMGCVMETLGLTLPGDATIPAVYSSRLTLARETGAAAVEVVRNNWTARKFITKASLRNALTVDAALGCSTNTVLHLLAIANEAGVDLSLETFNEIADRTPNIVKLAPSGPQHMEDLLQGGRRAGRAQPAGRSRSGRRLRAHHLRPRPGRPVQGVPRPRRERHQAAGRALPRHRRPGHAVRQPGSQGRRGQGIGRAPRDAGAPRPGHVLRRRALAHGRHREGQDRARDGRGHPLRRTQRRSGHARDAHSHLRHRGGGSRLECGAHHRRPLQRRQPGSQHRPRGA